MLSTNVYLLISEHLLHFYTIFSISQRTSNPGSASSFLPKVVVVRATETRGVARQRCHGRAVPLRPHPPALNGPEQGRTEGTCHTVCHFRGKTFHVFLLCCWGLFFISLNLIHFNYTIQFWIIFFIVSIVFFI